MPKRQSDCSDCDSEEDDEKFVYKKPQVWRLDKFKVLKKIVINLSTTQYPVVADVAQDLGWKVQHSMEAGDWDVYWTDIPIDTDTLIKMHLFQKINYYPGIHTLARKNLLGMNLMTMKQRFPNDYNFFPLTWMLPQQYSQFRQYYQTKKQGKTRTYIGRGIFLTRNIQDLQNGKHYVVQRYIAKPYLIQGLKFDLRIYVLLAGTNPLRLYIYQDGLARFATEKYTEPTNQNLQQQYMHLTNYAINKRSPKFVFNNSSTNMGIGHKRSLKCTYEQLKKKGMNVDVLKKKINDLIIKTIIAGLPLMAHQYKCCQPQDYSNSMCFHVIGFDVMLDHREEPQLIQINHTPSFATDTPLDYKIKFNLIKDTLKLMHITSKRKSILFNLAKQSNQARLHSKKRAILDGAQRQAKVQQQQAFRDQYQNKHLGGYTRIYPLAQTQQQETKYYEKLMQGAYKMHYAENTPIRLKLQQTEKKKQSQEDIKNLRMMQEKQRVVKGENKKRKNISQDSPSLKRANTIKQNQSQVIKESLQNFNIKKTFSLRQASKKDLQQNHLRQSQPISTQQDITAYPQAKLKEVETPPSRESQDNAIDCMTNSQCFMDTSVQVTSQATCSQSTTATKNQAVYDSQGWLHKSSDCNRSIGLVPGCSKVLTSIQRQLTTKKSSSANQRLIKPSTQKFPIHTRQLLTFGQIPSSCKQVLSELFNKQQKLSRQRKAIKESVRELPNIYDPNELALMQQSNKKSQSFNFSSKRTPSKNQKANIGEDARFEVKGSKRHNLLQHKLGQMPQMNRLMARKVNFSHFKGSYNNSSINNMNSLNSMHNHANTSNNLNSLNNLQLNNLPGPGGFVVPKTFHLNVQSQKRIQASQNILAMISRKNVNKNIFPL